MDRGAYQWNDKTFPGLGVDLCRACGEPTRDHTMLHLCPHIDIPARDVKVPTKWPRGRQAR